MLEKMLNPKLQTKVPHHQVNKNIQNKILKKSPKKPHEGKVLNKYRTLYILPYTKKNTK